MNIAVCNKPKGKHSTHRAKNALHQNIEGIGTQVWKNKQRNSKMRNSKTEN